MSATNTLRRAAVFVAIVTLSGANALVSAQSLADLAKKEEERRKAVAQPAKVYTTKDLTPAPPGSTPPPPPATKDAADGTKDAAAKDADASKEPVKDQKYWSEKMKTLRDQLDRDKTFADAIQNKINSLTTDFVNRDDPVQKQKIEADRQKALAELARLNKAVIDGTKAVADFEEAARRAGVPPGWLR
jgi:hypothetical protein